MIKFYFWLIKFLIKGLFFLFISKLIANYDIIFVIQFVIFIIIDNFVYILSNHF